MNDNVNSPNHYKLNGQEVIDLIKELTRTNCEDPYEGYIYGNIIKYLLRFKRKNGLEDLKKAQYYLNELISEKDK